MQDHGGFEHNLQSLRVVDVLERMHPDFDGLNLSFEAREGILKHCRPVDALRLETQQPGDVAYRFVHGGQTSLEAQVCDAADEIAYNAHDIDDGLRSGLLHLEQLDDLALFAALRRDVMRDHPLRSPSPAQWQSRIIAETLRRMIEVFTNDLTSATGAALAAACPRDVAEIRAAPRLVVFSEGRQTDSVALKQFLRLHLYRHPSVDAMTQQACEALRDLVSAYSADPGEMTADFSNRRDIHRAVADYVAGMTDRFALLEHQRVTGRRIFA